MKDRNANAKLAAKLKLVTDLQEEVRRHQAAWLRTGDRLDLYRYKAAKKELNKAEGRYDRYRDKLAKRSKKT